MSVTSAMYSGVSGLLNNAEAINVIGNNISNVNTVGFKYGRTLFADMLSQQVAGSNSQIGRGSRIQAIENLFSQGAIAQTESVTDLAIAGNGFFVVQDNSATPTTSYTRAGAFHPDENAQYLVNPDGLRLCDSAGAPINLTTLPNFDYIKTISSDGKISYMDTNGVIQSPATPVIGIATFKNPQGLSKAGGTLFSENLMPGGSGAVTVGAPTKNNKIFSNSLEQSNVDIATQFVNMITTQRAYSANSKTITTSDEMTQDVINLKR